MRILIVVVYYYPSTSSAAKLIGDLALELKKQGHKVTILTPSELVQENLEICDEDGVRVVRAKTGKLKGVFRVLRAFRETRVSSTLWRKGKNYLLSNPADLVIYYSPTIFFGGLVEKLKAHWKCRTYLILRDIFPQWAVDAGILKKGLVYRYFRTRELQQYRAADVIGVQSPANLKYFEEQTFARKPSLEVLYNWTQTDQIVTSTTYRTKLRLEDKVVFFYGGNIGVAQDMDNIVRLAERLQDQAHIYFLLVGEGSETERLRKLIEKKGLRNMAILDAISQEEYLKMLSEFDVGLISLNSRLKTQNIPGKLLGYLQVSIPILASINEGNDLKDIIEINRVGLVSINGDDEALYENAKILANDVKLRKELGNNTQQLLQKHFAVSSIAAQILSHVKNNH